jgi:peptidoglycan/xylan/chitin deacetylase (PgdA/CDA1 family)
VGYWGYQLGRTNYLIERITGERPRYFRPPVGLKTPLVAVAARREGMRMVTWSRRGRDGVNTTAERIVERLAEPVRGGDIVTLHDGVDPHGRREVGATIAALGPILQRWRERGVVLERLDWVIERGAGEARGEPRG